MATSNYIDLVLAKPVGYERKLFYAPAFSRLEAGDVCLVEIEDETHANGIVLKSADVVSCITIDRASEAKTISFILRASGMYASDVHRVVSRIVYKEFDFKEVGDINNA